MRPRSRDPRYETIKPMFNEGKIKSFSDIFQFIKKSVVSNDLGKHNSRFNELMKNVDGFTVQELRILADFFGFSLQEIFILINAELEKRKTGNM